MPGINMYQRERKLTGRKAFSAKRTNVIESLPPENRSAGRSNWPATSRRMCIASASSSSK
jgi:hypothetical protein